MCSKIMELLTFICEMHSGTDCFQICFEYLLIIYSILCVHFCIYMCTVMCGVQCTGLYLAWVCWERVIANLGAAILGVVGEQKCVFQLCLLKYMFKTILIIEINHITHVKHLGSLSVAKLWQNFVFWKAEFQEKKTN